MGKLLSKKTVVVMGVANQHSIAWGAAQALMAYGAKVILTYQNKRILDNILRFFPDEAALFECDVTDEESVKACFQDIHTSHGQIDGLVHSVAYAPKTALTERVVAISQDDYQQTQAISAYSLISIVRAAEKIIKPNGSIATLTYFGSERAVPHYGVMGIAKASLEASVRYLASELGEGSIRVNAISAGAIKTLAVTGIKNYKQLLDRSEDMTVDGTSVTIQEVGKAIVFLMSDLSTGVTGDVIYVDKGVHLH